MDYHSYLPPRPSHITKSQAAAREVHEMSLLLPPSSSAGYILGCAYRWSGTLGVLLWRVALLRLNSHGLHGWLCGDHGHLRLAAGVHLNVFDLASLLAQRARPATADRTVVVAYVALYVILRTNLHTKHDLVVGPRDAESNAAAILSQLVGILAEHANAAEIDAQADGDVVEAVEQTGRPLPHAAASLHLYNGSGSHCGRRTRYEIRILRQCSE